MSGEKNTETSTTNSSTFLVLTSLLDASARPASVTRSHGDAYERALKAIEEANDEKLPTFSGVEIVELSVAPKAFAALRKHLKLGAEAAAIYDLFPVAGHLSDAVRKIAGQFLAADVLWTLEEQGMLGGVPLRLHLDLPANWNRDPKEVHKKLVAAGALDISSEGVSLFRSVKTAWDSLSPS